MNERDDMGGMMEWGRGGEALQSWCYTAETFPSIGFSDGAF